MTESSESLRRQIKLLNNEISSLRRREREKKKLEAEKGEIRSFLAGVDFFMLKLMQGHVPFRVIADHLADEVDSDELRKLYDAGLSRPRHISRRALAVIFHLYGNDNKRIRDLLYVSRNTVKRYIRKFEDHGVDALLDTRRKTIRVAEDPALQEKLLSILHSPPGEFDYNRTAWTIKLLALEMGKQGFHVSRNSVSKILKKAGYKFWKAKEVLTSNDPKYKEKLKAITKILSKLKPTDRFFSIDEFGPFAVKQRGGRRLVRQEEYPTVPQFQRSKGSLIVTAALELSTNQITHFYSTRKDSAEMIKMLQILIGECSGCRTIYMSWDHASWHSSRSLFAEIEKVNKYRFRKESKTPIVKLAPLPARSQFLNVIESVFSGMASAIIQNSDYESVDQAKHAIDRYFSERNEYFRIHPKRAGNKIWGKELVAPVFKEGQNCKNPKWR